MSDALIFVSFSTKDSEFATQLTDDLKKRDKKVWLCLEEIRDGYWDLQVEEALELCTTFIVVLSDNSEKSANVRDEIVRIIRRKVKPIPLLIGQCDIPIVLERYHRYDFTGDYDTALKGLLPALDERRSLISRLFPRGFKFNMTLMTISVSLVLLLFFSSILLVNAPMKQGENALTIASKKIDSLENANSQLQNDIIILTSLAPGKSVDSMQNMIDGLQSSLALSGLKKQQKKPILATSKLQNDLFITHFDTTVNYMFDSSQIRLAKIRLEKVGIQSQIDFLEHKTDPLKALSFTTEKVWRTKLKELKVELIKKEIQERSLEDRIMANNPAAERDILR
jgi:hypothetical protein